MVVGIVLTWRFKLGQHEVPDFTPAMDWPLPVLAEPPEPDVPVMVTIAYRIQPDKRVEFVAAMPGSAADAASQRRLLLAAISRLRGSYAFRRGVHRAVADARSTIRPEP
jgi:hypothetical protein